MAKTDIFSVSEVVSTVEAITGVQAPVMEDFVQVANTTINNEHGIARRQQNLRNNLKSSSGIERIPFNGIEELDTEQGPNGEPVFALNTGDSRIRFVGSGWTTEVSSSGTAIRGSLQNDFIEITFFGTNINLLSTIDGSANVRLTVDGGTEGTTNILAPFAISTVLNSQNITPNTVLPLLSTPLTAGIHTVKLRLFNAGSATFWRMSGIEIINENAAITQQPGADFDGRVSLLNAQTFPIKPTNTPITSRNDSSGADAAFTGTTGARVLNYLTSGGQQKQVYEPAVEKLAGSGANLHTITFSASGAGAVTLPADVTSWSILTFGSGAGGGGGASRQSGVIPTSESTAAGGGGGGGGGRGFSNFTKTGGGPTAIVTAVGALGTGGAGVSAGPANGTSVGGLGNDGNTSSVTVGGTELISATGGLAGTTAASAQARAGFNNATHNPGSGGIAGIGAGSDGAKGSTNITASDTTNSDSSNAGDDARNGSPGTSASVNGSNLAVSATGGLGGAGGQPGGSAGGDGGGANVANGGQTSAGDGDDGIIGSIVITFSSASGTALTVTGGTDVVTTSGAVEGAPFFNFGTTDHSRQQVIRRINFREFGANNQFGIVTDGEGVDRAFTLDDGTTTLTAGSIVHAATFRSIDYLSIGADTGGQSANMFTITFVGTGLDVFYLVGGANATRSNIQVFVDGFSIGTFDGGDNFSGIMPIVSGLAYGTHTVRFQALTASENDQGVSDFIIYGPKKPEIPTLDAGSLELSDYNVMADFVGTPGSTTTLLNRDRVGKGTLRKMSTREFIYTNEAVTGPAVDVAAISGFQINMENGNVPFFYTFYGTGCEFRFSTRTDKVLQFFIDQPTGSGNTATPLTLTSANFLSGDSTTYTIQNGTAGSFNGATVPVTANGQVFLDNTVDANSGFRVSGLTLGVHTIAVMGRTSSMAFRPRCVDVITPIHINDDTLKVGSEGLNNLTIDPVVEEDEAVVQANLGEAKAWVNYDPVNNRVLSSFNIAAALETTTNNSQLQVFFDKPFKDATYVALSQVLATSPGGTGNIVTNGFKQANFCRMQTESSADTFGIFAAFYGELIDE